MIFVDDRTKDPAITRQTHPLIVMMTDKFLSGWGQAKNGTSYAGWACRHDDLDTVEHWVRSRSDAMRVRIVSADYRPPNIHGHCHIYVVDNGHPALHQGN